MNKIKEAIKRLEELKEHCKSIQKIDECTDYNAFIKAIDTVFEEMTRHDNGCELCKNYDFTQIGISKDINRKIAIYFIGGYDKVPIEKQFNYCPMCGRKLKE